MTDGAAAMSLAADDGAARAIALRPQIRLVGVGVRYGALEALKQVDLELRAGERVAFIGANGSGKSTLLRVLHGLQAPSTGSIEREAGLRQAMVFQRPAMLRLSVAANVALGLWLAGVPRRERRERVAEALARVGLSSEAKRPARALSGGQQQRLALARAWALAPQQLLLDEPTASLDPSAKQEVETLIGRFAQAGATLLFSSHNLGQVKRLATRVVYLEHGRVLADRSVHEFFEADGARLPPEARQFLKGELPW